MGGEGSVGISRYLPYEAKVQRPSLVFCWQASFISPGGSVTSSNEGYSDPSVVPVRCSVQCREEW